MEYDQIWANTRHLNALRFSVLALTIGATGAGLIAVLSEGQSVVAATVVGVFGLIATLCLFIFDARNGQQIDELAIRGAEIETELGRDRGPFRAQPGAWLVFDSGIRVRVSHRTALNGVFFAALVAWLFVLLHPALQALLTDRVGGGTAVFVAVLLATLIVTGLALVAYQVRDDRIRWLRRRLADSVSLFRQGDVQRAASVAAEISDRPSSDVLRRAQALYRGPHSDAAAAAAVADLANVPLRWVTAAYEGTTVVNRPDAE